MWSIKYFEELSVYELREIYALRVKVFIVEQNCSYQDVDDNDIQSIHLFKRENEKIIAYARLIPDKNELIHLGRVVVHADYRNQGNAGELLQQALLYSDEMYPGLPIHAQAQAHLQRFYSGFGFQTISNIYLEDNIPHIDMIRSGGTIIE